MGLVFAGFDEAGYGPLLGPLCVGMTAVRLDAAPAGDANLWKMLKAGVCKKPSDRRGRIAVADSKALKLANDCKTHHPLAWLERGVLAFLRAHGAAAVDDRELFSVLGVMLPRHPCYAGSPTPLPVSWDAAQIGIASNVLARALSQGRAEVVSLSCRAVCEETFNQTVNRAGSKARATMDAIASLLSHLLISPRLQPQDELHLVCDRLGGRARYGDILQEWLPGAAIQVVAETPVESRYRAEHQGRLLSIAFVVDGDVDHLPTALASMVAKFVRELMMLRFNRHWCAAMPDLKPTAGYRGDAWRWLREASVLSEDDRRALVRIA